MENYYQKNTNKFYISDSLKIYLIIKKILYEYDKAINLIFILGFGFILQLNIL